MRPYIWILLGSFALALAPTSSEAADYYVKKLHVTPEVARDAKVGIKKGQRMLRVTVTIATDPAAAPGKHPAPKVRLVLSDARNGRRIGQWMKDYAAARVNSRYGKHYYIPLPSAADQHERTSVAAYHVSATVVGPDDLIAENNTKTERATVTSSARQSLNRLVPNPQNY